MCVCVCVTSSHATRGSCQVQGVPLLIAEVKDTFCVTSTLICVCQKIHHHDIDNSCGGLKLKHAVFPSCRRLKQFQRGN